MSDCCETEAPAAPPAQAPVSWCAGNRVLTYQNGRISSTARVPPVPDGTYVNATVTMVDGCITAIVQGTNVLYSACDPCVVPPPAPPAASVPIDGNSCNLSSFSPVDGLLTQLVTAPGNCIQLNGCGTAGSPLTAAPVISPDAGNSIECRGNGLFVPPPGGGGGVNFLGCGIQITNGLWTAVPLPFTPILGLVSTDGSVLFTNTGCVWDLSAVANPAEPTGAQAFNVATSAELPPLPGGSNGMAVVGAANPRQVWMFINGIGWREIQDSTNNSLRVTL